MALSPFAITWALDSNVMQCPGPQAAGAAQTFLDAALRSSLWGYDIAHSNQHPSNPSKGGGAVPHNWNILYGWNSRTSNLFRDWMMLMLRRGISSNDQGPLHIAELRQQAAGGLTVGQVPTEFGAAFLSMSPSRGFYPRITRTIGGFAHVVHGKPEQASAWCAAFNGVAAEAGASRVRQYLMENKTSVPRPLYRHLSCPYPFARTSKGTCPFGGGHIGQVTEGGKSGGLLRTALVSYDMAKLQW